MIFTCSICNKDFFSYNKRRKTCSKKCSAIKQQNREEHPCSECGNLIVDCANRFRRYKRCFCNRKCAHNWEKNNKIKFPKLRDKDWCKEQYKTKSLFKISQFLN